MTKRKHKLPQKAKMLQRFFAVAGNIAPEFTLNILVKTLFTPRRRALKPAHVQCMKTAETFSLTVDEFGNTGNKLTLQCYSWGKSDKTVVLAHGWDSRTIDFYKLIPVLVSNGYRVVSFDGPGHGNSEGERTNFVDFKEILYKLIKEKTGIPYAIVGHSMGAGASVYMLIEHDIKVKRLVTITMPTVAKRFFEVLFSMMAVPPKMQRVFFNRMAEAFGEPVEKYNLIDRKAPIKADDMLVIYDEDDHIVPVKDTQDFLKHHPEVKSFSVNGVGHYSIIKHKQVIEEIIEFLK